MPHPAALPEEDLLALCDLEHTRGSGPGGQKRNKVSTAVRLTHRDSGITVVAAERRSQLQNKSAAIFRLRVKLAIELRSVPEVPGAEGLMLVPAAPLSALWLSRVKDNKLSLNPSHKDFPTLLAEALDQLQTAKLSAPAAAKMLRISTSQLIKLLAMEPAALEHINAQRQKRGMNVLKSR